MIANTFIKRPVTAIVVSIVLMISGTLCLFNLAVDQYPNISPPSVSVSGAYTGADAQTVEQTVAIPIEEQVNGAPGMEYMQSTNTKIEAQKTNVANNAGDPNAMKGSNKTLDELEGQKKALQRQNDKLHKDILIWVDQTRANDRFIADTKEKEASQRALIEKQKEIVSLVKDKLASIK